jgi:hypothetical protein
MLNSCNIQTYSNSALLFDLICSNLNTTRLRKAQKIFLLCGLGDGFVGRSGMWQGYNVIADFPSAFNTTNLK